MRLTPSAGGAAQAPAFVSPLETNLAAAIARRRARVAAGEFTPLGALERLQIEASGIGVLEGNSLAQDKKVSASLDWYKTGPLLGLSRDEREILVCGPMLPPPPLPDPKWEQPAIYDGRGFLVRKKAPLLPQELSERACGQLQAGRRQWLIFQPIHQMLVIAAGKKGWLHLNWQADAAGRHCCLIYHPPSCEAHILCGRFEIVKYE